MTFERQSALWDISYGIDRQRKKPMTRSSTARRAPRACLYGRRACRLKGKTRRNGYAFDDATDFGHLTREKTSTFTLRAHYCDNMII